jgi:hypothetical protein
MRAHIEPLAQRGDKDAVALLTGPEFPSYFGYLFEWFAEFLLWDPHDGPRWSDWQGWVALMQRPVTPWDLVQLRRIHDAYFASVKEGEK